VLRGGSEVKAKFTDFYADCKDFCVELDPSLAAGFKHAYLINEMKSLTETGVVDYSKMEFGGRKVMGIRFDANKVVEVLKKAGFSVDDVDEDSQDSRAPFPTALPNGTSR
jgi:hypothetical protein